MRAAGRILGTAAGVRITQTPDSQWATPGRALDLQSMNPLLESSVRTRG